MCREELGKVSAAGLMVYERLLVKIRGDLREVIIAGFAVVKLVVVVTLIQGVQVFEGSILSWWGWVLVRVNEHETVSRWRQGEQAAVVLIILVTETSFWRFYIHLFGLLAVRRMRRNTLNIWSSKANSYFFIGGCFDTVPSRLTTSLSPFEPWRSVLKLVSFSR